MNSVLRGLEIAQDSSSVLECVSNRYLSQKKRCSFLNFGCNYSLQIQKLSFFPIRYTNHKKIGEILGII